MQNYTKNNHKLCILALIMDKFPQFNICYETFDIKTFLSSLFYFQVSAALALGDKINTSEDEDNSH